MGSQHCSRLFIMGRIKHTSSRHNVEWRGSCAVLIHKELKLLNLSRSEISRSAIVTFGERIDAVEACGPRHGPFSRPHSTKPDRNPRSLDRRR